MFDLLHWITCDHRDVHRLPPPETPIYHIATRRFYRNRELIELETGQPQVGNSRSVILSAPTPGPKDVTIG